MKQLFATAAILSVVIATVLFAQTANREEPRQAERHAEEARRDRDRPFRVAVQSIEDRIHQLRETGHIKEAERMARELREHIEREHAERHRDGAEENERRERERQADDYRARGGDVDEHGPHGDREHDERVQHLRVASEHLHAAGFHDEGERVMQHANRLEEEFRGRFHGERAARQMDEIGQHLRHVTERLERLERIVEKLVDRIEDEEEEDEEEDDDEVEDSVKAADDDG